jgi:hypothetical protein
VIRVSKTLKTESQEFWVWSLFLFFSLHSLIYEYYMLNFLFSGDFRCCAWSRCTSHSSRHKLWRAQSFRRLCTSCGPNWARWTWGQFFLTLTLILILTLTLILTLLLSLCLNSTTKFINNNTHKNNYLTDWQWIEYSSYADDNIGYGNHLHHTSRRTICSWSCQSIDTSRKTRPWRIEKTRWQ